jgi:hypothetical protein
MKTIYAVLLLTLCVVAPSFAAEGKISISPYVGSFMLPSNENINSRPILGARAGYTLADNIIIEGDLNFGLGRDRNFKESNSIRYGVDMLYLLPTDTTADWTNSKISVFFAGGIGGNILASPNKETQNYFTLNAGVGVKYLLIDNPSGVSASLRGDIRQILSFEQSTRMNLCYTGGVSFTFGSNIQAVQPLSASAKDEVDNLWAAWYIKDAK